MFRKSALLAILILGGGTVVWSAPVRADTPLTQALVKPLHNPVSILPPAAPPYPAKLNSVLTAGSRLSTAQSALAELQFNDGSLTRVGAETVVHFTPGTRILQLMQGTVLLLVPVAQGQTQLHTPNATANFQGSALFVRYIPATDVTLIGSLTDSGVTIANRDQSQRQVLKAGQFAVVVKDHIEQVYGFDLNAFYETSPLVQGLKLDRPPVATRSPTTTGTALATIRTQTTAAANAQGCQGKPGFASPNPAAPTRQPVTTDSPCATDQTALPTTTGDSARSTTAVSPAAAIAPTLPTDTETERITVPAATAATLPLALPPTVALPTTNPDTLPALANVSPGDRAAGLTLTPPPGVTNGSPPPNPSSGSTLSPPNPPAN